MGDAHLQNLFEGLREVVVLAGGIVELRGDSDQAFGVMRPGDDGDLDAELCAQLIKEWIIEKR